MCVDEVYKLQHFSKTSSGILISSMGPTFSQGRTPNWECSASSCSLCNERLPPHHLSYQSSQSAWMVTSVAEVRWKNSRLVAFYKAVNKMSPIPVGQPRPCSHQTRSYDPLTFTLLTPRTDYYKYSFLPCTIVDCNSLRAKPSVDSFRAGLQHRCTSLSLHHLTEQNHNIRIGDFTTMRYINRLFTYLLTYSSSNGPRP